MVTKETFYIVQVFRFEGNGKNIRSHDLLIKGKEQTKVRTSEKRFVEEIYSVISFFTYSNNKRKR